MKYFVIACLLDYQSVKAERKGDYCASTSDCNLNAN